MPDPKPPEDLRALRSRPGPRTGSGDGAAYGAGYGAGGLGSGVKQAAGWDAPGVTPDGRRTGTAEDGPRIATGEESEPDPGFPGPEPNDE
jgi:hypothetical protein